MMSPMGKMMEPMQQMMGGTKDEAAARETAAVEVAADAAPTDWDANAAPVAGGEGGAPQPAAGGEWGAAAPVPQAGGEWGAEASNWQ